MKRYRRWISVLCILLLIFPMHVMATENKEDILKQKAKITSVTNHPNEIVIYDFFENELGFNTAVICAVLANLYTTSHFNADAYYRNDTSGSECFGLCQWSSSVSAGNRYQQLRDWCLAKGYDYKTIEGQLHFIKYELETIPYYKLDYLKNHIENTAEGAYEAAKLWSKYYEGCDKISHEGRALLARDTYWETYQDDSDVTESTPPKKVILGDVNGDGEVKLNDALLLRRYIAGYQLQIDLEAADLNGDGEVKLNDALLLRRSVAYH